MLSAVLRFKLPELSEHHALCDLLRSFAVERPRVPLVPPSWDLDIVLKHLMSSAYEPLGSLVVGLNQEDTVFGCSCYGQEGWGTAGSFSLGFFSWGRYVCFLCSTFCS